MFADTWVSLDAYDKDQPLTALTLLIAESNANDKDKMVGLVCRMLKK